MPDANQFLEVLVKTISDATGMNLSDADAAKLEDSIGAITSAWALWNERIKEGVQALSGFQLPDLSEHIKQLSVAQQMLDTYNNSLNNTITAYGSIEAASDRVIQKIREQLGLEKQIAQLTKSPTADLMHAADQAELAEMERRRSELAMSGAVKRHMAGEIKVATAEEDEANLHDAKSQAEAARKGKEEAQKNLELIERIRESTVPNPADVAQYGLKFGSMTGTEAIKTQKDIIDSADVVMRRAAEMERDKKARDDERARRDKLLQEAGKEEGEAQNLGQQIPEQQRSFQARESLEYLKQFDKSADWNDLLRAAGFSAQATARLVAGLQNHTVNQNALLAQAVSMLEKQFVITEQLKRRIESIGK